MSTYIVAGQGSDFTDDIENFIEALLNDATNWTETAPARTDIKFGNEWFDDAKTYQIHVTPGERRGTSSANDGHMKEYEHLIYVHIFAKKVNRTRPAAMGKMERMCEAILTQKRNSSALQGARIGDPVEFRPIYPGDASQVDVWHSMATLHVFYVKADITDVNAQRAGSFLTRAFLN